MLLNTPLILASTSPRRQALLRQIGAQFSCFAPNVPEERAPNEAPSAYVQRLALAKAQAAAQLHPTACVLGADTTVVCQGQLLEKPRNAAEGLAMLALLSGGWHQVHTGVALCSPQGVQACVVTTWVECLDISPETAQRYWATGEPCDKAGGYAIQGLGAVFIKSIRGCFTNVVGLPLAETAQLLQNAGIPLWTNTP